MTERYPMLTPAADSVHAFSHQRPPGDRPDKTPTSDSPKPVYGLTRRLALAGLAMLPVALPAVGAAIDPVFELIATHRKAHIAHMAALELQNRLERQRVRGAHLVSEKPSYDEDEAFRTLVAEPATTVQGLLAKLAYFDELAGEFETEWMVHERPEPAALIESFAASLENIGVRA
jgi:hypothetical protein